MFNVKSTRDWVTKANNKANVIRSFFTQGYYERHRIIARGCR